MKEKPNVIDMEGFEWVVESYSKYGFNSINMDGERVFIWWDEISEIPEIYKQNKKAQKAYRALNQYIGEDVTFEPKGFYEMVTEDGLPVERYGIHIRSKIPETAASLIIGGAIVGMYSQLIFNLGKKINAAYIYEISEEPDIDMSDLTSHDWGLIQEVRFRRTVKGSFIGKFQYSENFIEEIENYYELIASDDPDVFTSDEKINRAIQFQEYIPQISEKELKKKFG